MNVKRLSKRTLATLLSVLLLLSTLVVGTATTANAASWNYGSSQYIYFDYSKTTWSTLDRIRLFIVTPANVYAFKFTNIGGGASNSKLAYLQAATPFNNTNVKNEGIDFISFAYITTTAKDNDLKSSGATFSKNLVYDSNNNVITNPAYIQDGYQYSGNYDDGIPNTSGSKLLFTLSSSPTTEGHPTVSMQNVGTTFDDLTATQVLNVTSGGEVEYQARAITGNTTSTTNSGTIVAGGNGSFKATYSSTVTLTATPSDNYAFDGWYDNSNKLVSNANPYSYTVDGEKSLTAKFSSGYTQSVNSNEGGTVSVSDGTNSGESISVTPGTNVTFTATPDQNNTFDGWYNNAQYTGEPVSTLDPYKINSVSSANTLYAKFSAVEAATEEDNDGTAPPEETAPANRNDKRRDVKSVSLSEQAVKYYTEEVKDVDSYKTADSGNSGVYSTFEILESKEDNKDQDSFDSIYADTAKSGDARYSKVSGEDDKYKYVIKNSLFGALYDIMSSTQTHSVSYPAYGKNSLAHYWLTTDSSKGNWEDNRGVYTFFYSDVDDYNHADMQREHIWPKSKASYLMKTGLGGSDLHHLRPAYGKVNNIKSNWGFASIKTENNGAFTYNSGWTNKRTVEYPKGTPSLWRADKNGETFIDVKDDVRGDVARILLYIYTRWREPNLYSDIFDSDGNPDTSKLPELDPDDKKDTGERIIYDKATLLDWMKNDPVSEWEMKRNDLTQDIQGNRNVFIDYPELAWLIFDENVPADMATPSRPLGQSRTEINKISESSVTYNDPVTIDISTTGNGIAEITAYDLTTNKAVKNGDTVERGDLITYTVVPDKSTITYVREYTTDSGESHNKQLYAPNQDTEYTFTKQAGYYDGKVKTGTDSAQEILKLTINSKVCELFYKINSKTATGGSGGSGSGMVTVINKSTKKIIENGDTVPNGTEVTFTFTPDYGSKYAGLTYVNTQAAENISGTDSYKYTTTLDCSGGSVRKKTFTVYFAQTFNNQAGSDDAKKHINNKGMRPDENDDWKDETDFTTNFEICGVQIKKFSEGNENKALRFVSVIDKNILDKAESYGYVIGKSDSSDYQTLNRFAYSLVKGNDARGVTMECTGSDNTVFGDYGKHDTTTNYKYITAAVEDIPDGDVNTTIIARPYVELKPEYVADGAPSVIYGQYVDFSTGDNYCSISTSYNHIYEMANTNKEEE